MSSLVFIYNIVTAAALISIGLSLLFARTIPHPYERPYRVAKRYMASGIISIGMTILVASSVGKFSTGRMEVLNPISLINNLICYMLLLCSLITLYDFKDLLKRKLILAFMPTLFFATCYGVSLLLWEESKVYSIEEYIYQSQASPVLILKSFVLISMATGTGAMTALYCRSKSRYQDILKYYALTYSRDRIKRLDRMFLIICLAGITACFAHIITSYYFGALYCMILIAGSGYYAISLISIWKPFRRHGLLMTSLMINSTWILKIIPYICRSIETETY